MNSMRSYLMSVTAAALICALARCLLGERGISAKAGNMTAGILLSLVVLKPWIFLEIPEIGEWEISWPEGSQAVEEGIAYGETREREFIMSRTLAYIMDKAEAMGLSVEAQVELATQGEPVPIHVTLTGQATSAQREELGAFLSRELGIGEEAQEWIAQP